MTYLIGATLGNRIVTTRRFKPEDTLKLMADHKADMLVAVPTMLHRIVELGPDIIGKYDTSSLKTIAIAGSALTPELSNRVQDTFGDVLYNIYASTECGFATIATPEELRKAPGTAGRSPIGCEVVLFDENGQRVHGANKRGRIFVRSAARFEGYTDGRNKQIIDGYMSSGDMGHFDESGLLFVEGRDDDMIVSGGENVFPQEVENLLIERDDVFDAAVVGVDDSEFGKRLRAFIVSRPGAPRDAAEIKLHVKNNLARYKVPRDVVFIDELPRNATGKLLRRVLTEMDVEGWPDPSERASTARNPPKSRQGFTFGDGIPPEQVVGSTGTVNFEMPANRRPFTNSSAGGRFWLLQYTTIGHSQAEVRPSTRCADGSVSGDVVEPGAPPCDSAFAQPTARRCRRQSTPYRSAPTRNRIQTVNPKAEPPRRKCPIRMQQKLHLRV